MLMMQPYQQSIQESNEDPPSSSSIQVLHHVLKKVLRITTDERVSFTKWMQYQGYLIIQDICEGVPYILEDFHIYCIVNGQLCVLKYSTINTLNLFTSWVITGTNQKRFDLPSQYFLSLTYQEFNKFRQENMSRMTKVPTTQTPSIAKSLLGHNTKGKLDYIPHLIDLYDESVCESAEENLLHLKELKSIQLFVGATTNLFELPKPSKTLLPINLGKDSV